MVDTTDRREIEQDLQKIANFAKETEKLLAMFRRSRFIDKETKDHQKRLEQTLALTNKILNNQATSDELSGFEDLVNSTEMSLQVLKESKKDDAKFQKEFVRVFGAAQSAGSLTRQLSQAIAIPLKDVIKSVGAVSGKTVGELKDVGLDFATGPFGKLALETINFAGLQDTFSGFRERRQKESEDVSRRYSETNPISAIADGGITNAPSEGTIRIKRGERVLSPGQNTDLKEFLAQQEGTFGKTGIDGPIDVISLKAASGYFDPILSNDGMISTDMMAMDDRHHEEVIERFRILNDVINKTQLGFLTKWFIGLELDRRRWMRHPILMSLDSVLDLFGGVAKTLLFLANPVRGIMNFFKKKETDTDKIVGSNLAVVDAIKGQTKRGGFFSNLFNKTLFASALPSFKKAEEDERTGGLLQGFTKLEKLIVEKDVHSIAVTTLRVMKEILSDPTMTGQSRIFEGEFTKLNDEAISTNDLLARIHEQLRLSEEHLEDISEKKSGGGLFSSLLGFGAGALGIGKKLGLAILGTGIGKSILGIFTKSKIGGSIIAGASMMFGKISTALKGIFGSKFGKMITGVFKSPQFWGIFGRIFSVGSTFFIGKAIGDMLVKPLFDSIDELFGGRLTDLIGNMMVRLISTLENIPGVGWLVKQVSGGEATKTLEQIKENDRREAEFKKNEQLRAARAKEKTNNNVPVSIPTQVPTVIKETVQNTQVQMMQVMEKMQNASGPELMKLAQVLDGLKQTIAKAVTTQPQSGYNEDAGSRHVVNNGMD